MFLKLNRLGEVHFTLQSTELQNAFVDILISLCHGAHLLQILIKLVKNSPTLYFEKVVSALTETVTSKALSSVLSLGRI
jgi:hypothetical protein